MRRPHALPAAALLAVLLSLCTEAQEDPWHRSVPMASAPPRIDGVLSPEEWQGAAVIADFRQTEPLEGGSPSEETRFYLLVDREHLFIGIDCRDREADRIRASQITRDAVLDPDDRIEVILDTFLDRRNAYFFQIGPGGSKGDALIGNNGDFFLKDWDGIWEGRARVHEEGWSAEMAIPAKTLSLKPGLDSWGFNATRHIKRKNEVLQWASPSRRTRLFNIASAGSLDGLAVLDQGKGLDVVPFLSSAGRRNHRADDDTTRLEPGLDLRYRLSPSLTGSLTVNTDFAETEVDNRVVNLTRFPVFFPEKRDFFLEDAAIFAFGGLEEDLVPFFTRRIGLSGDGRPVPIRAGGKLTGRVGAWNLGVLDVATDDLVGVGGRGNLPAKNLAAIRVARNVLAESQVGALLTTGDPTSDGDNTLAGLDFLYRTRRFLGNRNLTFQTFALGTRDEPEDGAETATGHAVGARVDFPNDRWTGGLGYREVSADFRPDLGFTQRQGIRNAFGGGRFRPRPASPRWRGVRRFGFGTDLTVIWEEASGEVESADYTVVPLEVVWDSGDGLDLAVSANEERLFAPFEVFPGVVLPPDRYTFDRYQVNVDLADKRPVSGSLSWATGGFFSGDRDTYELTLALRLLAGLESEITFEHNDVRLPQGDFSTNLARLRVKADFSPEVSWITFLQWDDTSDTVGTNSRLRFILAPGRDLFLVVNRRLGTRDPRRPGFVLSPELTDVTLKAEYTLRF
jgi:hypothetical protein